MPKFFQYLFILACHVVVGQIKSSGQPVIKNFLKSEYRGGTQTWAIAQAANGTLFMANNAGLLEFDGSYWHTYSLPDNTSMRALAISNDTIFIGGYDEFGYFHTVPDGKYTYTSLSDFLSKEEKSAIDNIWKIHNVKGQIVFQSFDKNYIFRKNALKTEEAPGKFQFSFNVGNRLIIQDIKNG